ncbi:MAG: tyrosine-protein phosphatase [Crocinitomicaceae bacterium]
MLKRLLTGSLFGLGLVSFLAWVQWYRIRKNRLPASLPTSLIRNPDKAISLRRTQDTLSVEWEQKTTRADLFLSDVDTDIDFDHPVNSVENQQFAILQGIDKRKRYQVAVKLDDGTILHQIERVLPLESVPNFRDIGGYQTQEGRGVRWNRVYRSSALDNLSLEDSQTLEALNIQLVCDVRSVAEQLSDPDKLPDTMRLIPTPPSSDDSVLRSVLRLLFQAGFLENLLLDLYQRVMVKDNPQVLARILQEISDETNLPMVIHCAAGKDRTGISIALLLSLLGVPDETIIADYSLSNYHYDFFKIATRKNLAQLNMIGISEADFDYLLVADADIMQKTLNSIRHGYGSVETYCRQYLGLSAETIAKIRENLLD